MTRRDVLCAFALFLATGVIAWVAAVATTPIH